MSDDRSSLLGAVITNNIDDVLFQDPFQEDSRKAKRNLVAVSFSALLIAALGLQVNGFLGLQQASEETLNPMVTMGIACVTVIYFLTGFAFSAFVDYSAWKFKRERYLIKPYLDLMLTIEQHEAHVSGQLAQFMSTLQRFIDKDSGLLEQPNELALRDILHTLNHLGNETSQLQTNFRPLMKGWAQALKKVRILSWRLKARFFSLWLLDIVFPLFIAGLAIWRTHDGVAEIISIVFHF